MLDDIVKAIQQMKRPTLAFPPKPTKATCLDANGNFDEDKYKMVKFTWKEEYKGKEKYKENKSKAWALTYNHCSPELKNKLKGTSRYNGLLLMMIRSYCCQFDTLNDEYMLIVGALKNLLYFLQKTTHLNADYHKDFMAMVEVIEEYGGAGSLTYFPNMIKKELDSKGINMDRATTCKMRDAKKIVPNMFLVALMLSRASGDKYGELKHNMAKNYVTGTSEYPESPEVVMRILSVYTPSPGWNRRIKQEGGGGAEGVMFAQLDGDDLWKKNITCHKCGKKGHFARECRNTNKNVDPMHANFEQQDDPDKGENIFMQNRSKWMVNKNFLQLDNQRTLLKNIRKLSKPITVHCNAGVTKINLEGELGGMTVHHNPNSIANMLSLKSVVQKHRVTYNSWDRSGVFMM